MIILNQDDNDRSTVVAALTIKTLNPDVYTIAEVNNKQNKIHFENANVDEIVVTNQINSRLLIRTAFYEGTSNFIEELLSNQEGNEVYMFKAQKKDLGQQFIDLLNYYKQVKNIILLGIKRKDKILTNPDNNELINGDDELIYIARNNIL